MRRRPQKPFIIAPPTLEELGVYPQGQQSLPFRAFRIASMAIFVTVVSLTVGLGLWLRDLGVFQLDDSLLKIVGTHIPQDNTSVFDRDGNKIGEFFRRYQIHTPFDRLPTDVVNAIVAVEDRNFFHHKGIDPKGMVRALKASLLGRGYKQGASTITQQVVRDFLLSREKTLGRKVKEIALALRLEQRYSKQKIFELYVNKIFLGNGAYGVAAAARRYFGKTLDELSLAEATVIAGLFQSPSRYNPSRFPMRAKKRQRHVIRSMVHAGMISPEKAIATLKQPLDYKPYKPINSQIAPYFVDHVRRVSRDLLGSKAAGRGYRIYTTLDPKLQKLAQRTIQQSDDHFTSSERLFVNSKNDDRPKQLEASLLSVDPRNGDILAMVGGRDYSQSQFNRTTQATRSPGSAFKPIVYSLALEKGWRWSDLLLIAPISVNGYRPKNVGGKFLTESTLIRAFYKSLNTATVELGMKLGLDQILEHAKALGIASPLKREPGTMLGSSDLTMLDLARVYSVFANKGVKSTPRVITRIEDRSGRVVYEAPEIKHEQILSRKTAFLMTQGLRSVLTHGTGVRAIHLARQAAGKTGTSNEAVDNWFCGYSNNLVSLVWVGTDERHPMTNAAGGNRLALPLWDRYMTEALKQRPAGPFKMPKGITMARVHAHYGHRTKKGMRMYFLRGQAPKARTSEYEARDRDDNFRSIFSH